MNKVFVLLVVFAIGCLCGYYFPFVNQNSSTVQSSVDVSGDVFDDAPVIPAKKESPVLAVSAANSLDEIVKQLDSKTPKTQFEGYRAFQKLDQLSVDEVEQLLLSLGDSQPLLKGQVAWFLSGKFPERAISLMNSSMSDNQMPLAQTLFSNLVLNQPEQMFDWLQNNENDFVMLFPRAEQQRDQRMYLFQALAVYPDWKWAAYEAGVELFKKSDSSQGNWGTRTLAVTVAKSNPREAFDYALAQHDGEVDAGLLNGALTEYAQTNPLETKTLIVENQKYVEGFTVDLVMNQLIARGNYSEVLGLARSLNDKKLAEYAIPSAASKLYPHGNDKVLELLSSVSDADLKVSAVGAVVSTMSASGLPIETKLEIMDSGLQNVSIEKKVGTYAWVLKSEYKNDTLALKNHIDKLKYNDKAFGLKLETVIEYMNDI